MHAISLQSGSNGNCFYVETGDIRLLIDAGISGKQAEQRLAEHGVDIRHVDAVLISHDHRDHAAMAGIYQRKFQLPLYITADTLAAANARHALGKLHDVNYFVAGESLLFGSVRVETLPTPHDGVDGVSFVIESEDKRLGVLTDLGHVFEGLGDTLASLDAVFLESNYDPDMLAASAYPAFLKQRIAGQAGHLSNEQAALLIDEYGYRLQWVTLAHLSEESNTPEKAIETHRAIHGMQIPLFVAPRYEVSAEFFVE